MLLLALLGAPLLLSGCGSAASDALPGARPQIRAVTLDARQPPGPATWERLEAIGASHVTLVSFGFQPALDAPEIRFHPDVRWYSESDEGVRTLAREAAARGMGVILKPQLWVARGAWTADIDFDDEVAWQAWEADYRALLLHAARLAEEVGADLLVVGTELGHPVRERPDFWRALIAEIRTIYGGRLTYAANWHDDFDRVPFWPLLDYVGVQAYFPISTAERPSPADLRAGWRAHEARLVREATRAGRPILFTEIGYRSVPYAAREPWRWPEHDEADRVEPDEALQAALYEAFFESCWEEPWFAGAILWKWYPEEGIDPSGRHALDFTPQQKAAERVVQRWFGAP